VTSQEDKQRILNTLVCACVRRCQCSKCNGRLHSAPLTLLSYSYKNISMWIGGGCWSYLQDFATLSSMPLCQNDESSEVNKINGKTT